MRPTQRTAAVAAVTVLALAGTAGIAWSYFSTSGTGTGSAATSAGAADLTIAQVGALTALYPGDAPQSIAVRITNNAANNAYVATLTTTISSVVPAAAAVGTCDATDYTLVPSATVANDLSSGASILVTVGTLTFNNKNVPQDGCKGATVNLAFVAA